MGYSQDLTMGELFLTSAHFPEICFALLVLHNDPVTALEREYKQICFVRTFRNLSHYILEAPSLHPLMVTRCKPLKRLRLKGM